MNNSHYQVEYKLTDRQIWGTKCDVDTKDIEKILEFISIVAEVKNKEDIIIKSISVVPGSYQSVFKSYANILRYFTEEQVKMLKSGGKEY